MKFLQAQERLTIYGYVVMENQLHLVAVSPNLSEAMQSLKSFTARKIIDFLEARSDSRLLDHLAYYKLRNKVESRYRLWQEGSHPQLLQNEEMLRQKLEYTHMNPVRRGYVDDAVHWRYSSARNYAGLPGLVDVVTEW